MRWITKLLCLLFFSSLCSAENITVTLLGTGTPRPDINRFGPAVLIQAQGQNLLFDTGRGVTQRLHQQQIPLNQIDKVFFTHLHSDHVVGFADLWLTSWIWQRRVPLQVWGPIGTQSMMDALTTAYQTDIHIRRDLSEKLSAEGVALKVKEIDQGLVFENADLRVHAFRVDHAPVKHAFGYRIEFADQVVVISGDTRYSENLIKHSQDVDLLIHEIAMAPEKIIEKNPRLQKIIAYHTSPDQAVQVLQKTQPKLAVFTHLLLLAGYDENDLSARIKQGYQGDFIIGRDRLTFQIGDQIQVIEPTP